MHDLRQQLEAFPELSIESGHGGLRVGAADPSGADVTIARDPKANLYVVSFADWHDTFKELDDARACFLLALSPLARVVCRDIGRTCVEAELQVADALGEWQPVSLHLRRRPFDFNFGARRERCIANEHIPADSPLLAEAARAMLATPTADDPVVIEADRPPLDRPLVRLKLGAIAGALAGAPAAIALAPPGYGPIVGAVGAAAGITVAFLLPPTAPWSQVRFTGADIELARRRGGHITFPVGEVAMVGGEVALELDRKDAFAPRVVRLLHAGRTYTLRLRPMDAAACFTLACRLCERAVRINFDGWSQPPSTEGERCAAGEILAAERSRRWRRDMRLVVGCAAITLLSLATAVAAAAVGGRNILLAAVVAAVFGSAALTALSRALAQRRRLTLAVAMDRARSRAAVPGQKLAA